MSRSNRSKKPSRQPQLPAVPAPRKDWSQVVATLALGAVAWGLLRPQFLADPAQAGESSLSNLSKRAAMLARISDPVERERHCIGLAAYARSLDRALAKDARVFVGGLVGKENGPRAGYFYFLRNYLFPREVRLSLHGPGTFIGDGSFEGVSTDSLAELQTNGFDLFIQIDPNGGIRQTPLTPKGALP